MNKIVYITGCLGFIGSHITRLLLSKGYFVIGVDKISDVSFENLLNEFSSFSNFKFIKKDINDLENLLDCDYIINTAAAGGIHVLSHRICFH